MEEAIWSPWNNPGIWFETLGNSTNSPWFGLHFPDYIEFGNLLYASLECWVFIREILHSCVWGICRYLLSKPAEASVHGNLSCDEVAWWLQSSHSMLENPFLEQPVTAYRIYSQCHPAGKLSNYEPRIGFLY
jgi:hypothetical protein